MPDNTKSIRSHVALLKLQVDEIMEMVLRPSFNGALLNSKCRGVEATLKEVKNRALVHVPAE